MRCQQQGTSVSCVLNCGASLVTGASLVLMLCVLTPSALCQDRLQHQAAGTQRELFVDGAAIDELAGDIKQRLHQPVPKQVVLTTDKPWEGNTSAYFTLFRDADLFRMYYRGSHFIEKTRKPAHREVTCYAESRDGIHWTKPELGLFEFNGTKKNNIVWDGIGTHCFTVFRDTNPACDPQARYKAISRGRPKGKKGLYVFQSADAIHWKLMHNEPVITDGAFDSQNLAFWDPQIGRYREYHRTFVQGKRAIMTGTSADFVQWTKPVLVSYQDGVPAQHLYTNAVQPYPRAPQILIGFPTRFLPDQGQRVEPTLMASRDGVHFHRWLDAVVPESAPKDRRGNRSNYMTWGLLDLPNRPKHYSVYATEAYYTGPDSRVRRFEYRKDGFVSVRGGKQGGQLLTKPIRLGKLAERLTLNSTIDPGGSIRVSLERTDGTPVNGFSAEECKPLPADSLNHTVTWKAGADLSSLKGQQVRLRFHIKQADVYAYQFQPWLR